MNGLLETHGEAVHAPHSDLRRPRGNPSAWPVLKWPYLAGFGWPLTEKEIAATSTISAWDRATPEEQAAAYREVFVRAAERDARNNTQLDYETREKLAAVGQLARVTNSLGDGRMGAYLAASTLEKAAAIGEFTNAQVQMTVALAGGALDLVPPEGAKFLKDAGKYAGQLNSGYKPFDNPKNTAAKATELLGYVAPLGRGIRDDALAEVYASRQRFITYATGGWSDQFAPWNKP